MQSKRLLIGTIVVNTNVKLSFIESHFVFVWDLVPRYLYSVRITGRSLQTLSFPPNRRTIVRVQLVTLLSVFYTFVCIVMAEVRRVRISIVF